MPHRAICPSCGKSQRVADSDTGQPLLCTACGTRFVDSIDAAKPAAPVVQSDSPLAASHRWLYLSAAMSLFVILFVSVLVLQDANTHVPPGEIYSYPPMKTPGLVITTRPAPTTRLVATTAHITTAPIVATTKPVNSPATVAASPVVVTAPPPLMPTTVASPPPARFHPVGAVAQNPADQLDDQIGRAIEHGTDYLLRQFTGGRLSVMSDFADDTRSGLDALAVYALLHAGEATHSEKLGPHAPLVDAMLKVLKTLPMDHGPATYARALRAAALAVYDRPEDRVVLRTDTAWILKAATNGSYSYEMPPPVRHGGDSVWDNSNSQYGALGAWSAEDAGVEVPLNYWEKIEQHWLGCQLRNGQWGYSPGSQQGTLSMTVAGITTLFVTQDQLASAKWSSDLGRPPFIPALAKGLKWLETDDNAVSLPGGNTSYNFYGLERAALASGFKYFGTHDWYRELAAKEVPSQGGDGSWSAENPIVDTSFTLLFLSRGRHPIFMNKLRFDGLWANRPRDISNLCRYAAKETERPMNWQVVSLSADWSDWMDSPVLYIASHQPPKLEKADYDKLRAFAENGGLIFTQSDGSAEPFNRFVTDLSTRLFPDYPLADLPPEHEIYHTLFNVNEKLKLQGVSNGSRLLLLHSPADLSKAWQMRDWKPRPEPFQLGLNVFIYAAGKANLRNKLKTPYLPEPSVTPIKSFPVARLRYIGNWDPEPAGWTRFSRQFLAETSVQLDPTVIHLRDLNARDFTFAHLTGTADIRFNDAQVKAVHDYVVSGGILLIDSCGGSTAFAQSVRADLLLRAFPKSHLGPLPDDHPVVIGAGEGMTPLHLKLRPHQAEIFGSSSAALEYLQEGAGQVLFTNLDLSTALLNTNTYTVAGYDPESTHDLMRNILLWILER